jgi:glycosyltransferase involved in cell wall biosynthesis
MRIIQIIDSLDAGGAERMAISFANALANEIGFSALVATRKEGKLRNQINDNVPYLFLNRKRTIDFIALNQLRNYVRKNKIEIVHAHGTSFFFAFSLKLICPSIKLIWHDHYGARVKQSKTNNLILSMASLVFSAIFVVNLEMKKWAESILFTKKVIFIPNFAENSSLKTGSLTLKGQSGKRIVCVANLKKPKNHIAILYAFNELQLDKLGWSLHFIGKDFYDDYSSELKEFVKINDLGNFVYMYDAQNDIQHILSQATIGILASTEEGFPVALLEYGMVRLAVASTNVGYCSTLITHNFSGLLFDPLDKEELKEQLNILTSNAEIRIKIGLNLHQEVIEKYSKEKIIQLLLQEYKAIKAQK